ncbi:MAG TPA: hypothetical protein VK338_05865 [Candidatus Nitrosocosmicus sp.]|nr:hypothetical protein [Candidatus Nitrosocosmicus sp.]
MPKQSVRTIINSDIFRALALTILPILGLLLMLFEEVRDQHEARYTLFREKKLL